MSITSAIPIGSSAERTIEVTREMTVAHFVETMPEVYGTPIMFYHMELTSGDAVAPFIPEGFVSVGVLVNVKHLAATPVGARVIVKATVIATDENTVTLSVEAHDGIDKIGEGIHARAPVKLDRFMKRVAEKRAAI